MTLDLYGHLMPGQADGVAQRLDELIRGAQATPLAEVEQIAARGGRRMDAGSRKNPQGGNARTWLLTWDFFWFETGVDPVTFRF